jgi:hypothetical protein
LPSFNYRGARTRKIMVDPVFLKGFACPQEYFSEELFAHAIREYAVSLLSLAVDQCIDYLEMDSDCLQLLLNQPFAVSHEALAFWSPALGHCFMGLQSGNTGLVQRGIIQTGLNLLWKRIQGHWRVDLVEPVSFYFGHFLLPESSRIEAYSDGREAYISLDGRQHTFYPLSPLSQAREGWDDENEEDIPHFKIGNTKVLVLSANKVGRLCLPLPPFPLLTEITPNQLNRLSSCVDILDESFPHYRTWVERVLTHLLPVHSPPSRLQSGNVGPYLGLIYMTDIADTLKTAEMLIHESSHLYYRLLTYYGDLVTDNGMLYYSPFVGMERPPNRILLAYHAFANVEIFYRECIQRGLMVSQCQRTLSKLVPDVDSLEQVLSTKIKLTQLGSCVFEPLARRRIGYV